MNWTRSATMALLSVAATGAVVAGTAVAAQAQAPEVPVSQCRDQIPHEIVIPGKTDPVVVRGVDCQEVKGDQVRGYSYITWDNPYFRHAKFHQVVLHAVVDKDTDAASVGGADPDVIQTECSVDVTEEINAQEHGGATCTTGWFTFGSSTAYAGDSMLDYNVKHDATTPRTWWMWGPPHA